MIEITGLGRRDWGPSEGHSSDQAIGFKGKTVFATKPGGSYKKSKLQRKEVKIVCEVEGCQEVATSEFSKREDGEVYYTYRCDSHPVDDPDYQERSV